MAAEKEKKQDRKTSKGKDTEIKSKKKSKSDDTESKSNKKSKGKKSLKDLGEKTVENGVDSAGFCLLADAKVVDLKLSSLFAAKPTPPVRIVPSQPDHLSARDDVHDGVDNQRVTEPAKRDGATDSQLPESGHETNDALATSGKRKRRHRDVGDGLEDEYMRKIAREEAKEDERVYQERQTKKQRLDDNEAHGKQSTDADSDEAETIGLDGTDSPVDGVLEADEEDKNTPPPQHETQLAASLDQDKAIRTVFLGNVSTSAITSNSARKVLEKHLTSLFPDKTSESISAAEKPGESAKLESIRFRSTPYSPAMPKKAAFAKREVVTATTHATNAYAVYSSSALAREAVRRLNGTMVLNRHLRVDSVAHPAPTAHKRCVFVGNLGFVDDETNIIAANEAEGREKRKTKQVPADVEEGLWRLFGKHGTVESVRVVRDKGTRVGKGIAYVQFTHENGVEGALGEDGKKDPPMLPRRLRVSRAKAMKRNAKPGSGRPEKKANPAQGYRRKVAPEEASYLGRIGKLMGKAAAARAKDGGQPIRPPESFVFEGHRASAKQGKSGLKLGKGGKKKGKPTTRSARRGTAFKAGQTKSRSA